MNDKYQDLSLEGPLRVRAVWLEGQAGQEGRWSLTNLEHDAVSRNQIKKLVQLRWGHELVNRQLKARQGIREIRQSRIPVRDRRAEPRRVRPNKTNYTEFHGDREKWRDKKRSMNVSREEVEPTKQNLD